VPFNLLSQLIDLSGELILSRNQFISKLDGDLLDNFKAMSQQISDLQDGLMKTRMQPLSTITTPFPRIIRDLSRKLKKEVKLEMEGENIELDKTVLEALGGPFTHILRNSMDHGIEIPE
jgi:two-component system chemotaxis sensor kinase CheA